VQLRKNVLASPSFAKCHVDLHLLFCKTTCSAVSLLNDIIILNRFLCAALAGWSTSLHSTVIPANIKIQFAVLGPVFSTSLTDVVSSKLIDACDLYKALVRAEIMSSW